MVTTEMADEPIQARDIELAPEGKCIHVYLISCAECIQQVYVERKGLMQVHGWWHKIGWYRIGGRGNTRGLLYCPVCGPHALHDEVGELTKGGMGSE